MTTNVIDMAGRHVASDSRWSFVKGTEIHYVDDTGFDKIMVANDVAMICAGDMELISHWKDWLAQPNFWSISPPAAQITRGIEDSAVSIALVTIPEGELAFCRGVYLFVDGAFMFTGTGWEHAMECFRANRDVVRSVESAKKDDFTGGTVRIVNLITGQGNLSDPQVNYTEVQRVYQERGYYMDTVTRKVTPVRPDAANDQAAVPQAALHFSAPTGHDSVPWTPEDHVRLGKALEQLKNRSLAAKKR